MPLHYWAGYNSQNHENAVEITKVDMSYLKANEWKVVYITFKLVNGANSFRPFVYWWGCDFVFNIAYLKLEKGNKATDWSPAPEDIDNIQIGGRNLLLNSGFKKAMTHWEAHACSNVETMVDDTSLSGYMVKFTSTGDGGIYQRKSSGYYPHGTVLTVSGYVKCSVAGKTFDVNFENSGASGTFKRTICTNQYTWYYFSYTYIVDWNTFNTVTFYGQTGADYYLKDLMLEYGNKASTWIEAPEDIHSDIANVDSKAENTKNQVVTLEANVNGITQRVVNTETNIESIYNNKENKDNRVIFARGTGLDFHANSYVSVQGVCITEGQGRGLRINILDARTLEHLAREDYDTYGDWNAVNAFNTRISQLRGHYIVIVTSQDASCPYRCKDALRQIGGSVLPDSDDSYREAYALIGKPGLGQGNGVEMYIPQTASDQRCADVSVKVGVSGDFLGVNSANMGNVVLNTTHKVAEIRTTLDSIGLRVQSTENSISSHATQLGQVDGKINDAKSQAV